jgi:Bacterial tandem repeat domain 1
VYGDPDSPLYAAVLVQRFGPAWEAIHGVDGAGYKAFLDLWIGKGYVPVLVSATGSFSYTIFAAVLERGITGPWLARYGMPGGPVGNAGTFQNENANALAHKMVLRSVAIYGTVADRRYAAVWHSNPDYVKSHGMGASAQALTQFIRQHAIWGNGPRRAGYTRTGSSPGASSLASSRNDGIDWAYVINTRDWPPATSMTLTDPRNAIDELLNQVAIG